MENVQSPKETDMIMYPPQAFYSVMCPRGDKTSHLVVMGNDVQFYVQCGWVELYRLIVKEWK